MKSLENSAMVYKNSLLAEQSSVRINIKLYSLLTSFTLRVIAIRTYNRLSGPRLAKVQAIFPPFAVMEVFLLTKEGIQDPDWNQSPPYDNRPLLTTTQLHRPAKISQKSTHK